MSNQKVVVKALGKVVLVNLAITTWTGRKKLRLEDLKGVDGNSIPPEDLASLGSKRIIDPKKVAFAERQKRRAERMLSSIGIRALGGWAIPEEKIDEVAEEMRVIREEYQEGKNDLIDNYEQIIESWIAAHPDWAEVIRNAITPVDTVRARLNFGWQAFKVQPAEATQEEAVEGLANEAMGMSAQLFKEVAKDAETLWEESFVGRLEVTRRVIRPIRAMRDKLEGLSFLHPAVMPVVEMIDREIDALPKTGPIDGDHYSRMTGLLFFLSDPDRMRQHGTAVLAQQPQIEMEEFIAPSDSDQEAFVDAQAPAEASGEVEAEEEVVDLEEVAAETEAEEPEVDLDAVIPVKGELDEAPSEWF